MAAATIDLLVDKGATYKKSFIYQTKDRVPIDLTGYTSRMQARQSYQSAATILDLSDGNGLVITPTEGRIEIIIAADVTQNISVSSGVYDLELVTPSGDVVKLIRGNINFREEVTR